MEAKDDGSCLLLRRHGHGSAGAPCNEMIEVAASREDLEAVVLVHQDAVVDPGADPVAAIRSLLGGEGEATTIVGVADGPSPDPFDWIATAVVLSASAARDLRFDPAFGASADASAQDLALRAQAGGCRALAARLGIGRASSPRAPAARRAELGAMVELRGRWGRLEVAPR
jgi:hypothetical protein